MTARINPTFLLKGLDPIKLLEDYRKGYFNHPITHKNKKITLSTSNITVLPTYSNNSQAPVYQIKDRNNSNIIIATSGHENFQVYTANGGSLPSGGRCSYCREDITTTSMGYPIAHEEKIILTPEEDGITRYRIHQIYWVEDRFCSFECTLGYIRNMLSRPVNNRDSTLLDSETLLKQLYLQMYPEGGVLRPAQDPKLLIGNGGSLSREEWSNSKHIFVRTDRVQLLPAKVEYMRQNTVNTSDLPVIFRK